MVDTEDVPLVEAAGRWAAVDVVARRRQPARDLSAMDGYAIRAIDVPGPWKVIGESAAGSLFNGTVGRGEAVRIFTGGVVPSGADCILIQENATRDGSFLKLCGEAPLAGKHVRRAGADFGEGSVLISKGSKITPSRVGLSAMGGHATLRVTRKLAVAIISTGNELVHPGKPTADYQIPSSNAAMVAAMLADLPVTIDDRGIVQDDVKALAGQFAACAAADIIVSIGGASVGDHDLVKPALEAAGANIDFWKIAMRPGKPVMAGILGDAVVLGLPGNPVSAYVTAFLLLKPLIAHLCGASEPLPRRIEARLGGSLPANGDRLDHVRGILKGSVAVPSNVADSSMLNALSSSNILILRDINSPAAKVGDTVSCLTLV
jgi:molybdopterin molybdotransferase